jgi:hypothetical protein
MGLFLKSEFSFKYGNRTCAEEDTSPIIFPFLASGLKNFVDNSSKSHKPTIFIKWFSRSSLGADVYFLSRRKLGLGASMYVERMEDSFSCDDFKVTSKPSRNFTGVLVRSPHNVDAGLGWDSAFGVVGRVEGDEGFGVEGRADGDG